MANSVADPAINQLCEHKNMWSGGNVEIRSDLDELEELLG
mgnify:CR=1 FL=1